MLHSTKAALSINALLTNEGCTVRTKNILKLHHQKGRYVSIKAALNHAALWTLKLTLN